VASIQGTHCFKYDLPWRSYGLLLYRDRLSQAALLLNGFWSDWYVFSFHHLIQLTHLIASLKYLLVLSQLISMSADRRQRANICYHLNVTPMAGPLKFMSLIAFSEGKS
jgi:hypothetical protein